jgi:soluble lytic murein transglycosylase-like protein
LGVLSLIAGVEGGAEARTVEKGSVAPAGEIPVLKAQVEGQDAQLQQRVGEVSAVGADLEQAQARVNGAEARTKELGEQTQTLERELDAQRQTYEAAKTGYQKQARAAYKGGEVEGLSLVLGGLLGSADGPAGFADSGLAQILRDGRESLDAYSESERTVQNTARQITQTKQDYEAALQEEKAQTGELRRREGELEASIARISSDREQTVARLGRLRAAEKARILQQSAATGVGEASRGDQLRIAKDKIVAEPVEPISKKQYKKLYIKSAKKYGFGEDWYVLAAVGKVESNHGENMGPSSSGAMGPMQFLPSTWETAGVDGNGDGEANIMDPRDAIPAAAAYLARGGAPDDWRRALFSYNHSDWYVMKVLGVAEGYRRLAHDDSVGPYI